MSSAREEILGRIRGALRDVPAEETVAPPAIARGYRTSGHLARAAAVGLFCERVRDYGAQVSRVEQGGVPDAVGEVCRASGLQSLGVPSGLPHDWRPDGLELVPDEGLAPHQLDKLDGALTGCAVAIAETGTVVLDGQRLSGRRTLTLLPDHHICVVRSDQVVELVPEAIAALAPAVTAARVPVTFVSGPSASSDIELSRVEGVHGPRHLVVLIEDSPG